MTFATNPLDGLRVYFEDRGGDGAGAPILLHGGLLDSVADVRASSVAAGLPEDEFRLIFVDHRGLGGSDKPHAAEAYRMPLRVADAVAVLDELGIERAHFVGMSWGGRLGFGIGEHAPERVLALVCGGQQPYAWPDSPLTRVVVDGLARAQTDGMEALVGAFEAFWEVRFPEATRASWLDNDPAALQAAFRAALSEGPVSDDLRAWPMSCLILMGAADTDFLDGARRAALEIPNAELVLLEEADHYAAHVNEHEVMRDAMLRTVRDCTSSS